MNRRGFFGLLAGLGAALLGVKAVKELLPARQYFCGVDPAHADQAEWHVVTMRATDGKVYPLGKVRDIRFEVDKVHYRHAADQVKRLEASLNRMSGDCQNVARRIRLMEERIV